MELETPVDEGFAVRTGLVCVVVDGTGAETEVAAVSVALSACVGGVVAEGIGVGVGDGVGVAVGATVAAGAGGFPEIT